MLKALRFYPAKFASSICVLQGGKNTKKNIGIKPEKNKYYPLPKNAGMLTVLDYASTPIHENYFRLRDRVSLTLEPGMISGGGNQSVPGSHPNRSSGELLHVKE